MPRLLHRGLPEPPVKTGRDWVSGVLKEGGAEHLLLIGEFGERLATVLDAADDSERERLLRVE